MFKSSVQLEIKELLGEGSQGQVFKGLRKDGQSRLAETVAVKILHSRNAIELWEREFSSLRRVRSPFCLQVLSFERVEGRPALLLEFVDGVSLADLGSSVPLDEQDIEEILCQIECGLRDLKSFGIFHGDLTPANVLIDTEGRIRLLDFGLANQSTDQTARLTPDFAAPERLMGAEPGVASDIYSLGRIEEFLRGRRLPHSPYLRIDPQDRQLSHVAPCPRRQNVLSNKVRELQRRRRWAEAFRSTTECLFKPMIARPWTRWVAMTLVSLITLSSSTASTHFSTKPRPSSLSIRTEKWLWAEIDGKPVGYAPVQVVVPADQSLELKWRSPRGSGTLKLKLKPGETLRLADPDFSH